jgi:hypothetical protein
MPQPTDLHTLRRENLHALIRAFAQTRIAAGESAVGVERAFAEQLQVSKSLLSHLKHARPISDAMAKQFESRFAKPTGWMSQVHTDIVSRPAPGEEAFIAAARAAYRAASKAERQRLRLLVGSA